MRDQLLCSDTLGKTRLGGEVVKQSPEGFVMLIGIVSDSHGHQANTQSAVRILERFGVECVIHCGDIGSTEIPAYFRPWETHYVLGNVDHNERELAAAIKAIGHHDHRRFGSIEKAGRSIAFLHGDDQRRLRETIESGEWDLVCYGHTHQAEYHLEGKTTVLNPGAIFRARPHSIAVVKLPEIEITNVPW